MKLKLTYDSTHYYLVDSTDSKYTYNNYGLLLSIQRRGGYTLTFTYNSNNYNTQISDSLGRQINFTYLANGLASTMTDSAGNTTTFNYTEQSEPGSTVPSGGQGLWVLSSVTYPDSTAVTYAYTDPNPVNKLALTSITDENGNVFASYTYDSTTGEALTSQHAGGADLTTVSYNDTAWTRTVTNALNKQTIYSLTPFQGTMQITSIAAQASSLSPASTITYTYDSNGFLQEKTSGVGNSTYYVNNSAGQVTSRTDGYGTSAARTVTTVWDATYNVPDSITEPYLTTAFTYTGGLLTNQTQTDTTTTSLPYSTHGETRQWISTYYSNGLLDTTTGPDGSGHAITYAYNTNGFISSVTDQAGNVTQVTSWNVWGEPLTLVDPNGVTTNYTYDLRARLKTITTNPGSNQAVTSFTYDNAGDLTNVTFPNSASLTYGYDNAHRLTSVTNNLGESVNYTLDAMGDRTQTQIKSASSSITKTSTAAFDDLARMLQAIGASSQTTTFTYDKDNNVVSATDPRSKVYQYAFDALDRLTQLTDPDSFQTTATYNGKSEVTGITDARSLATTYVRDGFGDVIEKTSPDTGSTTYWYDADGNLTKSVDARSVEVDYTYDTKDRLLSRTASGENLSVTYDTLSGSTFGVNRLGSISDPSGSTTLSYDQLGHVTQDQRVVSGFTYTTSYTNDASGNPLTITYPSGRIVNITRDAVGRISGITTQQSSTSSPVTILSSVGYEPFGPITSASYGNGVVLTQSYDQDYQLTSISATTGAATIQNLSYSSYDPAGNILAITDNLNSARSQSFTYDDLNRLVTAGGLYGSQSYTYDGNGNRLSATLAGVSSTYSLASSSNQLNSVTTGSATRSLSYLASGQMSGDQRTATSDYTFAYDGIGRMNSSALNGTTLATYAYNGFGQRVAKTVGSTVIDYIYDSAGRLLVEANGTSGAALREYIWLGDRPVAMVDDTGSSPVIYYIHSDHLGKPQKLTDSSASIDWDGVYDAFGNPASVTGSATMLLMSTGQYYDSETQLNQNGARDYDPTTGRYVESDPLGLLAGTNTYNFADGNPVGEKDPSGRFGLAGAGIGAAVGGGGDLAYQLWKNGGNIHCVNWGQVAAAAVAGAIIGSGAEFLAGGGLAALGAEAGEGAAATGEVLGDAAVDEGAAAESGAVDASEASAEATVGEESAADAASDEAMAADDSADAGIGETSASGDVGTSGVGDALTEAAEADSASAAESAEGVGDALTETTAADSAGAAEGAAGGGGGAPDFVVTSKGDVIPIPEGATGPSPTTSPGFQFNGGAGGNGLAPNVTDVRIMEPNAQNPTGYVNYGSAQSNGGWQSVNPYTGQSIPPSNPWWHIPINTGP